MNCECVDAVSLNTYFQHKIKLLHRLQNGSIWRKSSIWDGCVCLVHFYSDFFSLFSFWFVFFFVSDLIRSEWNAFNWNSFFDKTHSGKSDWLARLLHNFFCEIEVIYDDQNSNQMREPVAEKTQACESERGSECVGKRSVELKSNQLLHRGHLITLCLFE